MATSYRATDPETPEWAQPFRLTVDDYPLARWPPTHPLKTLSLFTCKSQESRITHYDMIGGIRYNRPNDTLYVYYTYIRLGYKHDGTTLDNTSLYQAWVLWSLFQDPRAVRTRSAHTLVPEPSLAILNANRQPTGGFRGFVREGEKWVLRGDREELVALCVEKGCAD